MSDTRHAAEGAPLRQERWAGDPELQRGLLAHLVARRCELLERPEDREIIWWLQLLSFRPGAWEQHTSFDEGALAPFCLAPSAAMFERDSGYKFEAVSKTLHQDHAAYVRRQRDGIVVTALGQQIGDTLDFTSDARCLTLVEGEARTGKTFAARAWCEQHPGRARFVEVPPGNDVMGFYRALSRGLGVGVNLSFKAHQLKDRVEEVLLTGQLLLCLDEAHRLWPQTNVFRGYPSRVNWVMAMVNQGVPICLVATPQFLRLQKLIETKTGWNGAQLTGRISHYVQLPGTLSDADLLKVARALLPEIPTDYLKHAVTYARTSAKYLAAVEHIARRARYLAARAAREKVSVDDLRTAMREGVIPSDEALAGALQSARSLRRRGRPPAEALRRPDMALEAPARAPAVDINREPSEALSDTSSSHRLPALNPDRPGILATAS